MAKITVRILCAGMLLLGVCREGRAGTTGKITGQVTDESGDLLSNALVKFEHSVSGFRTQYTDEQGVYFILAVEPGIHTLIASMIGYDSLRVEGVLVTSDRTTNQSFRLRKSNIELGEIVVEARRGEGGWGMFNAKSNAPPVAPDKTMSQYIVRAEDIEALSIVREMAEFIELQAGVAIDETGDVITVRAGNPEDVAYSVDGILLPTSDVEGTVVYRDFNRLSVQEMTVVTGGMAAEYGNAQGGLVSVVIREGGKTYHGTTDYELTLPGKKHWGQNIYESPIHQGKVHWDDPNWVAETVTLPDDQVAPAHRRQDYTGVWGHFFEGNFSGPLAKDLSLFASTRWRRKVATFPGPHLHTPFNLSTTVKFTSWLGKSIKVSVGGLLDRRRNAPEAPPSRNDGNENFIFLANPNPTGDLENSDHLFYVGITHLLSPRTFYEVRLAQSVSEQDTAHVPLPPGITHISEAVSEGSLYDRANHYVVVDNTVNWQRFKRSRLNVKVDLASQVTRRHLFKGGVELIRYNNWFQKYVSLGRTQRFAAWYGRTYKDTDFFPGQSNQGLNPIQLGIYVQDKIELAGMVVNAGLRFDALFQNTEVTEAALFYPAPMWNSMTRVRNAPKIRAPMLKSWNPRLGISHPLGEDSVLRFFYGRFSQIPNFAHLFINRWNWDSGSNALIDRDLNGNGVLDPAERWNAPARFSAAHNPHLTPEETISFEAGLDWHIVTDYILSLTTYYKSANNQIVRHGEPGVGDVQLTWYDPSGETGNSSLFVGAFEPAIFRDTRGLELSLRKRLSHLFAFNFALNVQWADASVAWPEGQRTFPDSLFVANGHFWTRYAIDPATGAEVPISLKEMARQEGKPEDFYIREYGHRANQAIRDRQAQSPTRLPWFVEKSRFAGAGLELIPGNTGAAFYSDEDRAFWERVNNTPGYPGKDEANLMVSNRELAERSRLAASWDRRMFGSLALLFHTPSDRGAFGGKVLGNLRGNLIYRLYAGTPFEYTPTVLDPNAPGGSRALNTGQRYGPLHTRTDLSIEKRLGAEEGRRLILGLSVFNLFSQKDARSVRPNPWQNIDFDAESWQLWGITGRTPSVNVPGEIFDINNYWDVPREVTFNVRFKW